MVNPRCDIFMLIWTATLTWVQRQPQMFIHAKRTATKTVFLNYSVFVWFFVAENFCFKIKLA